MIIAIKQKDKTVVGYTNADYKLLSEQDLIHEENLPLKFAPNGNLFAFCKLGRVADYLLCDDEFLATEITPQNIVNKIIPAIKQAYKKMKQPITSSNNQHR